MQITWFNLSTEKKLKRFYLSSPLMIIAIALSFWKLDSLPASIITYLFIQGWYSEYKILHLQLEIEALRKKITNKSYNSYIQLRKMKGASVIY